MRGSNGCVRCGNPAKPGRMRCADCTKKAAEWNRTRYHRRKSQGVCPHCGSVRLTTRRECGACRERRFLSRLKPIKRAARENMSWTISLAAAPRYLYVFLSGRFELQEFNEMLDDVFTVKENFPGHSILFSDLELDVKRLKPDEMASVSSKFVEKNNVIAETKVAIVMKTAEEFELADRWRSATEPMSEARFNIFRNERKAMKWLEQAV